MEEITKVVAEKTLENAVEEATQDAVSSGTRSNTGVAVLIGAAGAVATICLVRTGVKLAKKACASYKSWKNKRAEAAECDQEIIEADFEETTEESE